ncbi:hypothetical protein HYX14_01020 [Candidatus Woesearchaeota archaeon]|nr:hypothetical protein [Candidatus Woesearchaeota archaeon]
MKAHQQLAVAKHLVGVSYPLLKDQKLLIGAVHNLFSAINLALEAILQQDGHFVPDSFESRYALFTSKHKAKKEHLELLLTIKELHDLHKNSAVDFPRHGSLVMCTEDYRLRTLAVKDVEEYVHRTEEFLRDYKGLE